VTNSTAEKATDRFAIVFKMLAEAEPTNDPNVRVHLPPAATSELAELEELRRIAADLSQPYQPSYTGT
jgi:hypothetical protein